MADELPQQIELPPAVAGYIQGLKQQVAALSEMAAQNAGEAMTLRVQLDQERKKLELAKKLLADRQQSVFDKMEEVARPPVES